MPNVIHNEDLQYRYLTYSAVSEAGSSGIAKKTQLHKIVNMTR